MHAYFGQWKARCACFVHKNNLGTGESLLICVNKKKTFIAVHRFDRHQVTVCSVTVCLVTVCSQLKDRYDSDFLQIWQFLFFRLSEFFYPLLARLAIGAGVEQPFGRPIVQNCQAV